MLRRYVSSSPSERSRLEVIGIFGVRSGQGVEGVVQKNKLRCWNKNRLRNLSRPRKALLLRTFTEQYILPGDMLLVLEFVPLVNGDDNRGIDSAAGDDLRSFFEGVVNQFA